MVHPKLLPIKSIPKVPPRTPPQRLETLQRFFKEYIDGNVRPDRPDRANNQKEAVDRIYLPLQESFDAVKPDGSGLRRCSFFDPSVPNGGPRPVSATNTRAAEDWVAKLLCQFDGLTGPQCDTKRKRRSDIDTYDPFDDYEAQLENGERATAAVRLSNDKALALRQIRTGFQKWILRYVSECSGQREYGLHTKRLEFISDNVYSAMTSIQSSDIDFSTAMWDDVPSSAADALALGDRPGGK
jgi:hypothetical protein